MGGLSGLLKKADPIGNKITQYGGDPFNVYGNKNNPNALFAPSGTNIPTVANNPSASLSAIDTEGQQLLKNFQTGTLSSGEQALVDQYKKGANASLNQEMATAGLSTSSSAAQGSAAIDAQAATMSQQFLTTDLQNSMDLMGMNLNSYYQDEALQVQQEIGNQGVIGNLATAIGSIFA